MKRTEEEKSCTSLYVCMAEQEPAGAPYVQRENIKKWHTPVSIIHICMAEQNLLEHPVYVQGKKRKKKVAHPCM